AAPTEWCGVGAGHETSQTDAEAGVETGTATVTSPATVRGRRGHRDRHRPRLSPCDSMIHPMDSRWMALAGVMVASMSARSAAGQELRNDGFVDFSSSPVSWASGLVATEQAGSRFTLPTNGMYQVMGVKFLFGGAATQTFAIISVYNDGAGTDSPGILLFV